MYDYHAIFDNICKLLLTFETMLLQGCFSWRECIFVNQLTRTPMNYIDQTTRFFLYISIDSDSSVDTSDLNLVAVLIENEVCLIS